MISKYYKKVHYNKVLLLLTIPKQDHEALNAPSLDCVCKANAHSLSCSIPPTGPGTSLCSFSCLSLPTALLYDRTIPYFLPPCKGQGPWLPPPSTVLAGEAWSLLWSRDCCGDLVLFTCWFTPLSCVVYFLVRFIDSYVVLAGLVC